MALLDLLGRRWTLRVLWELRGESLTFRALQGRCEGVSSSVLNLRLSELRDVGIVECSRGDGYRLTAHGQALCQPLHDLNDWSKGWARRLSRKNI